MSTKPSETPRLPSSGAATDLISAGLGPLGEVTDFLVARGMIGVVQLDRNLIVTSCTGTLVAFARIGRPVGDSILPLLGLETELQKLCEGNMPVIDLANISIQTAIAEAPRINISVYWLAENAAYSVIVSRVTTEAAYELELQSQVRARLLAEEQVRQKSAELEAFAYIISHDLRTPLRALRHLSDEVLAALGETNPDLEAARTATAGLIGQSRRMSTMLLGLLEYAQIGRRPEAIERVDSGALATEITAGLRTSTGIVVQKTGAWPVFETFKAPLDLVLRNLIDNALKHHDRTSGTVTLSASNSDRYWVFNVADDGPGIAPEWHKAIFEPFRRVADDDPASDRDRDVPEGSGIGLALVKKTIETIGGRIDLQSDPAVARGTTFRVSWPKRAKMMHS